MDSQTLLGLLILGGIAIPPAWLIGWGLVGLFR